MYWWQRFDAGEVEADLALIRQAGFDSVRIFLLWEAFQPAPDTIAVAALRRLVAVADLAHRQQLGLITTLFTGHMSGVNWLPAWALTPGPARGRFRVVSGGRVVAASPKNWYTDMDVAAAQIRLAREVALALQGHAAVWAYDLGNESSNCAVPPTREAALAWLDRIAGALRSADAACQITLGLHMEDLEEDRGLTPREAATVCDFLCMHGYPLYAPWAAGPTDAWLLPFLGLITQWLGGRPVLFAEYGATAVSEPHGMGVSQVPLLPEAEAARYLQQGLVLLRRFGFLGALLWCFGDYSLELWQTPPLDEAVHERFFGLWRRDRSAKPAVAAVQQALAATEERRGSDDMTWIDMAPEHFYTAPSAHLHRLYRRFCEQFGGADMA